MRRRYLLSRSSLDADDGSTVYLASYGVVSANDAGAGYPRRPVGILISTRPGGAADVETSAEWEAGNEIHNRGPLDIETLLALDSSGNGALRQQQARARRALGAEQREYDAVTQRRVSDLAVRVAHDEITRNLNQVSLIDSGPLTDAAAVQIEANVSRALQRHLPGASFSVDHIASRNGQVVGVTSVPPRGQDLRMSNRFGNVVAPVAADQHIRAGAMVLRDGSGNVTVSVSPTITARQVVDAINAPTNIPPDASRLHAAPRSWSLASSALGRAAEAASASFSGLAGAMGSMQRAAVEAMRVREESMAQFQAMYSSPRYEAEPAIARVGVVVAPALTPAPPLTCEAVEIAPSAPQRLLGELMPWLNEEIDLTRGAENHPDLDDLATEVEDLGFYLVYVASRKALRVATVQELDDSASDYRRF